MLFNCWRKAINKPDQIIAVRLITVSEDEAGQRLDNYLLRQLKGVPKTRLYKAVRKGEVRVNKGRVKPDVRLNAGDVVRIPPLREAQSQSKNHLTARWAERIKASLLLDNDDLMVINKPSGLAVHGGSGVDVGLIESLRQMYPEQRYMELVHRLDRDTSGLILVAKRASVLRELHGLLRGNGIDKRYLTLVYGRWPAYLKEVDAPLEKFSLPSGERMVKVSAQGKRALTRFQVVARLTGATLLEAKPITGRTHQIRVHARHAGNPILGDTKYGTPESQELTERIGLKRLFLHAASLRFTTNTQRYDLAAPLPSLLQTLVDGLDNGRDRH